MKQQYNDLIEIIDNRHRDGITCTSYSNIEIILESLSELYAEIVLDLHGVLDTVSPQKKLSLGNIACCSFVGRHSKTRKLARHEIINRIVTKQILWGVLVFKRKEKKKSPYTVIGSKAWFCKTINAQFFVDDSLDHIVSVRSIGNIIVYQMQDTDDLVEVIQRYHKKHGCISYERQRMSKTAKTRLRMGAILGMDEVEGWKVPLRCKEAVVILTKEAKPRWDKTSKAKWNSCN